jgi:hypothetical protein
MNTPFSNLANPLIVQKLILNHNLWDLWIPLISIVLAPRRSEIGNDSERLSPSIITSMLNVRYSLFNVLLILQPGIRIAWVI